MSTVQVAVTFAVEIWKFHNIDLFHQGAFQIRCYFKTNGSYPVIIEAPKVWDRSNYDKNNKNSFPECVGGNFVSEPENGPITQSTNSINTSTSSNSNVSSNTDNKNSYQPAKAVSKTVMIIYREESLKMFDVMEQTMYFQIDAQSIDEFIYKSDITLMIELWFGEKKHDILEEMKCVCERQMKVHFVPSQGLHHHITVMFDYYYLAAMEMVVHGSLVSISPCYLRLPHTSSTDSVTILDKNYYLFQSWHSIMFNNGKTNGRRHMACLIHSRLCNLLLTVIDNILTTFHEALTFFNDEQKSKIENKLKSQLNPLSAATDEWLKFSPNELERMESILQAQTCEEDIADQASIHITKLSSRILVLYNEFLKTTAHNSSYVESLSYRTHKLRIKRFSEAFFYQESSLVHLLAVYDPNGNSNHEAWINRIRESGYYRGLPPLPIECTVTDGESHDQPIIFEHIFESSSHSETNFCADVRSKDLPSTPTTTNNNTISATNSNISNALSTDCSRISSSSSSSATPPSFSTSSSSVSSYRKKVSRTSFETKSIPVMRKLNPSYKNKESVLNNDKSINLIGYRSLENSAFESSLPPRKQSTTEPTDVNESNVSLPSQKKFNLRQGLGTLREINGYNNDISQFQQWDRVKLLSQSLPNLSFGNSRIPVKIKKKSEKVYKRTQSWNCGSNTMSQSQYDLSKPIRNVEYETDVTDTKAYSQIDTLTNDDERLTIFEMLSRGGQGLPSNNSNQNSDEHSLVTNRSSQFNSSPLFNVPDIKSPYHQLHQYKIFAKHKFDLMTELRPHFPSLTLYSQLTNLPGSRRPYFSMRDDDNELTNDKAPTQLQQQDSGGLHYIICVHGLDGEHRDLRLVKAYLSLALPEHRLDFLMSDCNEGMRTFGDIREMKDRLVEEILEKLNDLREIPEKISFVGHSLGCLLIRAAVASTKLAHLRPKLHTFLSLGGPHLGTLYGSSVLVNMGLWFMQKLKKSVCLQQLALKDAPPLDPRQSYLYQLSGEASLQYFRYVLLASSPQDRYVPYHSTRIELCRASVRDSSEIGVVYMEMVTKLLQRVLRSGKTTVVRYDAHYTLPRSANNYIGRAAHIALIDSELFLEKFISVSAAKYFR